MSDYPPGPSRPRIPPRINTHMSSASTRSGHSPVKSTFRSPLYNLPTSIESPTSFPRYRPGGIAAQSERSRGSRRGSDESSVRPDLRSKSPSAISMLGSRGNGASRLDAHSPLPEDLALFSHHCRLFYFSQDPPQESAVYISHTLASLPPSQRSAYTRLQSSLRSLAHLHHLRVRISSFHVLISSTIASASLSPLARAELASNRARKERHDRMGRFISTWCTAGGVEPFFRGLWAVLRAQSRSETCLVWEIDDAVFMESGGTGFSNESITMLKGVLGFTDQALTLPPRLRRIRTIPRSYSERLILELARSRALSDPFTDPSRTPVKPRPLQPSDYAGESVDSPLLGQVNRESPLFDLPPDEDPTADAIRVEEEDLNKPRFRLWTFPVHLDNQEVVSLLSLFPRYRQKDVRLPFVRPGSDLESGGWDAVMVDDTRVWVPKIECEADEGAIRVGTGRIWLGGLARDDWRGSKWFRFKQWWKRLFGL